MKKFIITALGVLGIALVVVGGIVTFFTIHFNSLQIKVPPKPIPPIDINRAAETLAGVVRFKTFSDKDPEQMDMSVFDMLHAWLEERFPLVHQHLEKEIITGKTLMFRWKGRDTMQKAIILLAHQDVVPAPNPEAWEHPPFGGVIADGFIWGRGTLDDKGSMIGILEAVEHLLDAGFQPTRDIYLCFGHDEEVGGWNGAAVAASVLKERGVRAEFTLDEGMAIVSGDMIGLQQPIAFVCLTEKGYLSLELTAHGEPGHSSTPPRETTIGILAAAVHRITQSPMPPRLTEPIRMMFRYLGPEMNLPMRVILANLWLTQPLVLQHLSKSRPTDAAIRTTTAFTIIEGGETENVLPPTARAVVNYRLLPGDSVAKMTERTRKLVNDDRISISTTRRPNDSPPPSSAEGPAFSSIHKTIKQVFPDVLVGPAMMLGGSDSHHYSIIAENIYGFSPLRLAPEDLERIHGPNERIAVEDFRRMIAFYMFLLENAAGK